MTVPFKATVLSRYPEDDRSDVKLPPHTWMVNCLNLKILLSKNKSFIPSISLVSFAFCYVFRMIHTIADGVFLNRSFVSLAGCSSNNRLHRLSCSRWFSPRKTAPTSTAAASPSTNASLPNRAAKSTKAFITAPTQRLQPPICPSRPEAQVTAKTVPLPSLRCHRESQVPIRRRTERRAIRAPFRRLPNTSTPPNRSVCSLAIRSRCSCGTGCANCIRCRGRLRSIPSRATSGSCSTSTCPRSKRACLFRSESIISSSPRHLLMPSTREMYAYFFSSF